MLAYVLAGLVLGGIYAISATSIVVTYVSAGVLNFAFGAIAFFIARFYYYLIVNLGWPIAPAAILSVVIVGPLLGVTLQLTLFRFLTQASPLTKVVATIGLSVAIPAASELIFGNKAILTSPGLAPRPVSVYHFAGAFVTQDQIIAYICIAVVLAAGTYVLRRTTAGLIVRATVDSEALTSISGMSPGKVAIGVWACGTFLAGLAGVLAAPIVNVSSVTNYTLVTASAFAAVVAARLRNLPIAAAVGLLMGVLGSLLQWWLPASSQTSGNIIASIPFVMVFLFLVYYSWRGLVGNEATGGTLDRAIRIDTATVLNLKPARDRTDRRRPAALRAISGVIGLAPKNLFLIVAAVLPLLLSGYRVGLVAGALAMGIIFLSYTLLTGEGGMISLCQISFAGVGALTTAQVNSVYHLPALLGVVIGAVLAGVGGLIVGALTVRMGNLYVALVTLTAALLLSSVVFQAQRFVQFGAGVVVDRPGFALTDRAFAYFMVVMFVLASLIITAIRYSTSGLVLGAVRSSETGARATGINVVGMKIAISALAGVLAGAGGGFLAMNNGVAIPSTFDAIVGLTWFAVLVTNGTRSNNAALASGLFFVFLPDIVASNLPVWWGPVPTLLFGVGAVMLARHPEGIITLNGRQLQSAGRKLVDQLRDRRPTGTPPLATNSSRAPGSAKTLEDVR